MQVILPGEHSLVPGQANPSVPEDPQSQATNSGDRNAQERLPCPPRTQGHSG